MPISKEAVFLRIDRARAVFGEEAIMSVEGHGYVSRRALIEAQVSSNKERI